MRRFQPRSRLTSILHLMSFSCLALTLAIAGCSSDDGGGETTPTGPGTPSQGSGYVFKGAVDGATVHVRAITATGDLGAVVAGPFTTDATGRWEGDIPAAVTGMHAVTASGGTYTDEATGASVSVHSEMRGLIDVGGGNRGNVTPITHAVYLNGTYRISLGASKGAAFDNAVSDMTTALGFDPTTAVPSPPSASATAASAQMDIYTAILAGFSELLDSNPNLSPAFDNAETWDIVKAVAEDMSDGKLDGIDILGNGIMVDPDGDGQGELLPFPPLDADDISNLVDAARDWAAVNAPGVTIPDIDLSKFGAPTVLPGGEWAVTGSLDVTGSDAALLARGGKFTPAAVVVDDYGQGIEGFGFLRDNIDDVVAVGLMNAPGVRNPNTSIVSARTQQYFWVSTEVPPIPSMSVIINPTETRVDVTFTDVPLAITPVGPPTLTLNGVLTLTR